MQMAEIYTDLGCDCPDSVKITMGANEMKLCGSKIPKFDIQTSNGLNVKFCSDNKHTARGFLMEASKPPNHVEKQKREGKQVNVVL